MKKGISLIALIIIIILIGIISFLIYNALNNNACNNGENDDASMTIEEVRKLVDYSNISSYIGTRVEYHPEGDKDGIYRIFYLDAGNKYGDGYNTIYLKRDSDSNLKFNISDYQYYTTNKDYTINSSTGEKEYNRKVSAAKLQNIIQTMGKFNRMWYEVNGTIDQTNEYICAYLYNTDEWNKYKTEDANYVIGSPSIEMYIDSYNQWKNNLIELNCKCEKGKFGGYLVGTKNEYYNNGFYTVSGAVEEGKKGIYLKPDESWWIASTSNYSPNSLIRINGNAKSISKDDGNSYCICPVVSLIN